MSVIFSCESQAIPTFRRSVTICDIFNQLIIFVYISYRKRIGPKDKHESYCFRLITQFENSHLVALLPCFLHLNFLTWWAVRLAGRSRQEPGWEGEDDECDHGVCLLSALCRPDKTKPAPQHNLYATAPSSLQRNCWQDKDEVCNLVIPFWVYYWIMFYF